MSAAANRNNPAACKFNGKPEKIKYNIKEYVLQGLPPTNHLPLELWPPAKAEGIPNVIRAEDARSTENVFSYEFDGSDLRVLQPSVRLGTVSPTPAFRLGLGGFKEDLGFSPKSVGWLAVGKAYTLG